MRLQLSKEDFSKRQIQILNLLFEKEYQQKDLQEVLETSAPNLHYHLNRLEDLKFHNWIRTTMPISLFQEIRNSEVTIHRSKN